MHSHGACPGHTREVCPTDRLTTTSVISRPSYQWKGGTSAIFFEGDDGYIYYHLDYSSPTRSGSEEAPKRLRIKGLPVGAQGETPASFPRCMNGTHLAAVTNDDASRTVLLYQDSDGYLCYR